jgi:hypothetical protein
LDYYDSLHNIIQEVVLLGGMKIAKYILSQSNGVYSHGLFSPPTSTTSVPLKNERYRNDVMVFNIDLEITNTIIINIIIILF